MEKRVLVVDDFPGLLELFGTFLGSKSNITVETCLSAEEGLRKIQESRYDLIISDYDMRWMNGIEFFRTIRDWGYSTPLILLTGVGNPEIESDARNLGAMCLFKGEYPVKQFNEILHVIWKNLDNHGAQDLLAHP